MKITLAPREKVEKLVHYIDAILEVLGHPEALVTDESTLSDFCFESELETQQHINTIRRAFGVSVSAEDTLVIIAEKIRDQQKK